jgi:hypothetical protein
VFFAGDDAGAKERVSSFIESLGSRPLDAGDLKMAHWLEGAGLLMVAPGITKRVHSSCRAWTTDRVGRLYLCRRCPTACSDCVFDVLDTMV